jgi:site-specific DNA recombinase
MNAIYVRVSTEEQARSGYSIDAQLHACRAKLSALVLSNPKEYVDDGYSGEFIERPALDELRKDLKSGILENVIMYDPDRMARVLDVQLLVADEIEKAKAGLVFCTHDYDASPEGKLFFMIRGAISQFEKAKIRERTMSGKRAKAMSGKLIFNDNAFGYDYDKEASMYVINKKEADIVKLIFTMYTEKNVGTRNLALEINSLGLRNKVGLPFTAINIYRVLKNEMYAGTKWSFKYYDKKVSQYKKQRTIRDIKDMIAIPVPAIVSKETWDKAQLMMQTNAIFSKRNTKHEYLLSNVIKCGCCGYAMIGRYKPDKGKDYFYYSCSSPCEKRECNNRHIRVDQLDAMVWDKLVDLAKNKVDFNSFNKSATDNSAVKEQLEKHLISLRKNQAAVLKWVKDGILEIDAAEKELQAISKEITTTSSNLNGLQQKESPAINIKPDEILKASTFEQKRIVILKLKRIYAKKIGKEIDWGLSI